MNQEPAESVVRDDKAPSIDPVEPVSPQPEAKPQQTSTPSETKQPKKINKKIVVLIFVVVLFFLFTTASLILKQQPIDLQNKITTQVSQDLTSPSITVIPTTVIKPIYSAKDYVEFAHYNLGYTAEYPATNVDMHLVGATGGNFTQKYNDGSSILIYDIYPEKNTISKITIDNIMQQLTVCGEGGCGKFFEYKDNEIIQEKKIINLGGSDAYWIKTIIQEGSTNKLPPYIPIESAIIERFVIPQENRFLILELNYKDKISSELSKVIGSFRLIPSIPSNWAEYKINDNSKISFNYPNEYKIIENAQKKQIEIKSPNGTISLDYYDKNDEISKYLTNQTGSQYLSLESGYEAEKYFGNDITKLKFSINAFTYNQGGDNAIRVFDPGQQQVTVYFYAYGSPLIYRITSPENMEMVMNQILMSINELMR